jgi:hypothetical protein
MQLTVSERVGHSKQYAAIKDSHFMDLLWAPSRNPTLTTRDVRNMAAKSREAMERCCGLSNCSQAVG